MRGSEAKSC